MGMARAAKYRSQALARLCHCSLRQLERHFEQCQCQPPQEWLLEVRLWEAARFLIEGQAPKEASQNAGFKDLCHFYRKFTQYHGCTPLEFLEIYRQRELERKRTCQQLFPDEDPDMQAQFEVPVYENTLGILNRRPQWHPTRKRSPPPKMSSTDNKCRPETIDGG